MRYYLSNILIFLLISRKTLYYALSSLKNFITGNNIVGDTKAPIKFSTGVSKAPKIHKT